jgi:hypothetical protein
VLNVEGPTPASALPMESVEHDGRSFNGLESIVAIAELVDGSC